MLRKVALKGHPPLPIPSIVPHGGRTRPPGLRPRLRLTSTSLRVGAGTRERQGPRKARCDFRLGNEEGIAAARGQRRPNTTRARQRFNTATASLHAASGINSQDSASLGLLNGNSIEQDGKKTLNQPFLRFFRKTNGVVCPGTLQTRLVPFWWLFLA